MESEMNISVLDRANSINHVIVPDLPLDYGLDTDQFDSFFINQRYLLDALSKLSNGEGKVGICLYDISETRDLLTVYQEAFGEETLAQLEIVWVPEQYYTMGEFLTAQTVDWQLYRDSKGERMETAKEVLNEGVEMAIRKLLNWEWAVHIKSYRITDNINQIAQNLTTIFNWSAIERPVQVQGIEDLETVDRLWGKSFLHPNLNGEYIVDLPKEIRDLIPQGRFVSHTDGQSGLLQALHYLADQNLGMMIKPVNASAGEGIELVEPDDIDRFVAEYDFSFGDVIVEEKLNFKCLSDVAFLDGISENNEDPLSLSIQFFDGELMPEVTIQVTENNHHVGNLIVKEEDFVTMGINPQDIKCLVNKMQKFIDFLWLKGNGGFDFLITKDGKIKLIDPNLGRDTGAMPLQLSRQIFNDHPYSFFIKLSEGNIASLNDLKEGVDFLSKDQGGYLPISFVQGECLNVLIAADSMQEICRIYNQLLENNKSNEVDWGRENRQIYSNGEIMTY